MLTEAQAALFGAAVGGGFAVVGIVITQLWNGKWRREDQAERREEWLRSALLECYSNAIYYCFKLSISSASNGVTDKDTRQHLSEAERHLLLLEALSSSDAAGTLRNLVGNLESKALSELSSTTAPNTSKSASEAVTALKNLLAADLRVRPLAKHEGNGR